CPQRRDWGRLRGVVSSQWHWRRNSRALWCRSGVARGVPVVLTAEPDAAAGGRSRYPSSQSGPRTKGNKSNGKKIDINEDHQIQSGSGQSGASEGKKRSTNARRNARAAQVAGECGGACSKRQGRAFGKRLRE